MPISDQTNANGTAGPTSHAKASASQEIDLKALAKKIYELLKKEARVERERLGPTRRTW